MQIEIIGSDLKFLTAIIGSQKTSFLCFAVPDIGTANLAIALARFYRGSEMVEGSAELKEAHRSISLRQSLQSGNVTMHMGFKVRALVGIIAQERSKIFFELLGGLRRLEKRSDRVS